MTLDLNIGKKFLFRDRSMGLVCLVDRLVKQQPVMICNDQPLARQTDMMEWNY